MSNPPNRQRQRRAQRPADVTPAQKPASTPRVRQPIGRSDELMQRQAQMQQQPVRVPRTRQSSETYGSREGWMDYDQPLPPTHRSAAPACKHREKHTALWLMVALVCLTLTGVLVLFVSPQLLGVEFDSVANYAFVNGSVVRRDESAIKSLNQYRGAMATDRIFPGVYIDGVHVGGMTRDEAVAAVNQQPAGEGSTFAIQINVDGNVWSIDSDHVPMYRNTRDMVTMAFAVGRSNTTSIRATGVTPFRQRVNSVQSVMSQPVVLYTTTTYDRKVVRSMVDGIAASVNREPVNATVQAFNQATKTFTFNPDQDGLYIDADAIYSEVTGMLDSGVYTGALTVVPEVRVAGTTRAELMNRFGLVSSFTTKTTSNSNRNTNIDLAAQAINGRTVLPGETFSFNRTTGERTAAGGYKPASAIGGGETFDEIGGGVCQTSTTLFNAAVRADMTIVARDPHAWPSNYVDMGEDATVNWPNLDFRFRNDSDWPIFIVAYYKNRNVTVEIYGMGLGNGVTIDLESEVTYTKRPPSEPVYVLNPELAWGEQKETVKARTGYTVETYKVWKQNGEVIKREKLHTSHYKMYQRTIQYNGPQP